MPSEFYTGGKISLIANYPGEQSFHSTSKSSPLQDFIRKQ